MNKLVNKAKNGDKEAFCELILIVKDDLYKIAKSRLGNKEDDIFDAIQETIISAYISIGKLKKVLSFKSWIIKILINECNDILKKKSNYNEISFEENEYENYISNNALTMQEEKIKFEDLISILNEEEKKIMVLYYINGYNTNEIAKTLDIKPNTIRSKMSRAKAKILKRFNEEFELDNLNEKKVSNTKKIHKMKLLIVISFCTLSITTSIVFAKDIMNFVKGIFPNVSDGVENAIENGYIQDSQMEYIENDKIEIKIDNILMDDYNLDIAFNIKLKDNLNKDKISNFYIPNLLITDENDNIIVAKFENETRYEQFCAERNIEKEYKNIAYGDGSENSKITKHIEDYYIYSYTTHSSQFPKSQKLKIVFDKIIIKDRTSAMETLEGNWKIEFDLSEEFYNRESLIYEMKECNVEDLRITNAAVSKTGMKITLETKWGNAVYNENDSEEQKKEKIEQWLHRDNMLEEISILLIDNEYVENSNGAKFYATKSSDNDGGYTQSPDGKFSYHQTFNMTSFECTDEILVILPLNGVLKDFLSQEKIVIKMQRVY